jgi:uncharacterized damage-inducible protein DinB
LEHGHPVRTNEKSKACATQIVRGIRRLYNVPGVKHQLHNKVARAGEHAHAPILEAMQSCALKKLGAIMRKTILSILLSSLLTFPLAAQNSPQAPPKDLSAWLRNSYATNRKYLARTAEKMPEEFYGMRPGAQPEVRTFGQLIGHLASFNLRWCSDAKGEKNPMQDTDLEKVTDKASLVKALNIALAYCDSTYAMLTDANSLDIVQGTRDDGTKAPVLRVSRLISNLQHNNEHYGNLVTYMRIKSIVPPSSEPQ